MPDRCCEIEVDQHRSWPPAHLTADTAVKIVSESDVARFRVVVDQTHDVVDVTQIVENTYGKDQP